MQDKNIGQLNKIYYQQSGGLAFPNVATALLVVKI